MVLFETGVRIWRGLVTHKRFCGFAGFLLVAFFMIPVSAHSQAWSGILDPSRATDWSSAGVQGGIPTYTHVCQTVNPSRDTRGSTDGTNINNAFSTCAASASASSPQVVFLAAGTFYANASIGPPAGSHYLVLRGAGPDKTTIKWVGSSAACGASGGVDLCIAGSTSAMEAYTTAWNGTDHSIGTHSQRSSVLDLASTAGLAAGMILMLTQRNDSMGLCPQSGGTGNCLGQVGLTNNGSGTVTAITSAPYSAITVGAQVYIGSAQNHSLDGACGGYQGVPTPWTVLTATTTATNTTFTYSDSNTLRSPTAQCQPIFAAVDNGGLFTCEINGACGLQGVTAGINCPDAHSGNTCLSGEISRKTQAEAHIIKAVCTGAGAPDAACLAANEVVIAEQVIAPNYRTSQAPSVWWSGSGISKYSDHVGIEAITLDATNDGGAGATVKFLSATNFWYKNIRSINAYSNHVNTTGVSHGSIVDSYLYGTQHRGPSSYGFNLTVNTSYVLVQNNITQHVRSGIQTEQASGDIRSYNYLVDMNQDLTQTFGTMMTINHGWAAAELAEGNNANMCAAGVVHGTSWGITYFRNRCRGQDTPVGLAHNGEVAALDESLQRVENFVGNVLGTSGFQSTYVRNSQLPPFPPEGIYSLNSSGGYIPNARGQVPLALDPAVTSTLLRWGNYDVVTGATRWCGTGNEANCGGTSEIPTTGVAYINGNPVPASHTLPASFYLSARPQFWTMASGYGPTPPWPAIGPDVTGGTAPDGAGGFSYPIPAQLCYQHTPVDPSYQKAYSVNGASWTSGTATLATSTNALAVGDTISISGVDPSGYNGTWQVKAVTSNTVSFAVPRNLPAHLSGGTSGGTVTSRNILLFNAANCYAAYGGSALAPPSKLVVHSDK